MSTLTSIFNIETLQSILSIVFLSAIVLGFVELVIHYYYKKVRNKRERGMTVFSLFIAAVFVNLFGFVFVPLSIGFLAVNISPFALWELGGIGTVWGWTAGLVIYELSHWVVHMASHKVRLLWCMHAPHHAPEDMNIFVGHNLSVFEITYLPIFLGAVPALLGVDPIIIVAINVLDQIWNIVIHCSADMRFGFLRHFIITPNHHRVHHSKNLVYMDTNYTTLILLWDTILGTRVDIKEDEPPIYGITRDTNTGSYLNTHFGEFKELWKDLKTAPNIRAMMCYIFLPPGWSHDKSQMSTVKTQKIAAGLVKG